MRRVVFAVAIVLALVLGVTRPASATSIEFLATDLLDGGGGDLWQYDYFLTDNNFLGNLNGFTVYFDDALYSTLTKLPPDSADWDAFVANPISGPPSSAGFYDALALVDNPLFVGPFSVSFIWLGAPRTTPGSQPFDIYELDASGAPVAVESGLTSPIGGAEVPEPSTLLLLATGAAAGRTLRKRRRQSDR